MLSILKENQRTKCPLVPRKTAAEALIEVDQDSWVPVSFEVGHWDITESLGNGCYLFTVLLTLQDGGCSCPGDVAKAFGKDVGRAQEEDPIEEDELPLRV